jgi:hypothetical protein
MTVEELSTPELRSATVIAQSAMVQFTGSAEASSTALLQSFLDGVHRALLDAKASEVVVDLCNVEFMTSACLKQFLTWFMSLKNSADQYTIRLRGNKKRPWQRRSLNALACFSTSLIAVEWEE